MSNNDPVYFALEDQRTKANALLKKADSWNNAIITNNYLDKGRASWMAYYGAQRGEGPSAHKVTFGGEQGELTQISVNHYGNIAQHLINLTTANRPAMEAQAVNTDAKTEGQTILANGLLDYYMYQKKLEKFLYKAVESAVVLGEGFIRLGWNEKQGDAVFYDETTGQTMYKGDIEFSNLSPFDVVRDISREDDKNDWILVRNYKNRFDLAAKYPNLKDEILSVPPKDYADFPGINMMFQEKTDLIVVWEFYHRRTEAVPNGNYMAFVSEDAVFYNGDLPYREIPVHRITVKDIMGAPVGYTPMWDCLPLQEAINALYSTILTNQVAFGVQNILMPNGASINPENLAGGLNVLYYDPEVGKPEPLNLTYTPAEVFRHIEMLKAEMETISGINSVIRGTPEASLRSGTALALVQAQAVTFASSLQQSFVRLIEDVGTGIIQMLQDYADEPRIAFISGKSNRTYLRDFKGSDLSNVNRVIVRSGNALAKCLAKGTEVLMYDGSLKKVEDIGLNELVMGPDSKPRTVINVSVGQEEMFNVYYKQEHEKQLIYGCNRSHILSLKYCAKKSTNNWKKGDKIDISVNEYLNLPKWQKNLLMGYKTSIEFNSKATPFDPYGLGLWLGDGNADRLTITTADEILKDYWVNLAKSMGYNHYIYDQSDKVKLVGFAKTPFKPHKHILTGLGVYKNKHIPELYKTNSREVRLQVLAGLLDSDGCLNKTVFTISQTNNKLAKDIVYLARSLGFRTRIKKRKAKCQNGKICEYNSISISGDIFKIPTKLTRKQAKDVQKAPIDYLNYGITVESIGMGTYYGFTLKEEPHFVLGDFTVTHNTTAGRLEIATNLLQMGMVKTPEQYVTVLNTGKLEALFEGDQAQLNLIKKENEMLMDGKIPPIVETDWHMTHINEHQAVLADPMIRMNPALKDAILTHIKAHYGYLTGAHGNDLGFLMALGQQPIQMPPMPGNPDGGMTPPQGPQPGNVVQAEQGQDVAGMMAPAQPPGIEEAQGVRLPTPPEMPPTAGEMTEV